MIKRGLPTQPCRRLRNRGGTTGRLYSRGGQEAGLFASRSWVSAWLIYRPGFKHRPYLQAGVSCNGDSIKCPLKGHTPGRGRNPTFLPYRRICPLASRVYLHSNSFRAHLLVLAAPSASPALHGRLDGPPQGSVPVDGALTAALGLLAAPDPQCFRTSECSGALSRRHPARPSRMPS